MKPVNIKFLSKLKRGIDFEETFYTAPVSVCDAIAEFKGRLLPISTSTHYSHAASESRRGSVWYILPFNAFRRTKCLEIPLVYIEIVSFCTKRWSSAALWWIKAALSQSDYIICALEAFTQISLAIESGEGKFLTFSINHECAHCWQVPDFQGKFASHENFNVSYFCCSGPILFNLVVKAQPFFLIIRQTDCWQRKHRIILLLFRTFVFATVYIRGEGNFSMFSFIRRERFASEMKWKSFNNSPGASRIKLCERTEQKENVIMQLGKKWVLGTEPRDDTHPPRLKFHRSTNIYPGSLHLKAFTSSLAGPRTLFALLLVQTVAEEIIKLPKHAFSCKKYPFSSPHESSFSLFLTMCNKKTFIVGVGNNDIHFSKLPSVMHCFQ